MVQAHGKERYNCDTLEDLTQKFIPNQKQNFSCWIRNDQNEGKGISSFLYRRLYRPYSIECVGIRLNGLSGYSYTESFANGALRRIRITSIWDKRIINSIIFPITGCIFSTISCSIFCWKNKGNALKFTQSGWK